MSEVHHETSSPKPGGSASPAARLWGQCLGLVYIALAALFVLQIARLHDARTGFTPLVLFGDRFAPQRITRLRDVPLYTYRDSAGYDGQFYAQIAVSGSPFDPELGTALDSPAYRTGRILLPVIAHLAGLGRPGAVLDAYALSNVVCWLILAWTTARWWFPPTGLDNLLRWTGTMFGAGMLASVTRSLTDGPALLVIAIGMRCLELNRRWLAAGLLGAAGLVREMSVLAAAAFVRSLPPAKRAWRRDLVAASACVLPAVVWMCLLSAHYGSISRGGLGAFGVPGAAFVDACKTIGSMIRRGKWLAVKDDAYVVVAALVQVVFVLGRRRPALAWWRMGAAFAVLALFLGPPWDDPRWAVPRTLLPLTVAFNVLVPRSGEGLLLLAAGNLTVLSAPTTLEVWPREQTAFVDGITCDYASGWYGTEHMGARTWRWSSGSAVLTFRNPTTNVIRVNLDFEMSARTARTVTLHTEHLRQVIPIQSNRRVGVRFGPIELPPGYTPFALDTAEPPWTEPGPDGRLKSFSVQKLMLTAASPR